MNRKSKLEGKPMILYLRSFQSDGTGSELPPLPWSPFSGMIGNKIYSDELYLIFHIRHIGYLVAVARKNDSRIDLGFDLLSFKDEEWKENVLNLMKEASIIVVRPDYKKNLLWEFEQIVAHGYKAKVIIWTGNIARSWDKLDKAKYNVFRRKILELYNESFPDYSWNKKFVGYTKEGKWENSVVLNSLEIYKSTMKNNSSISQS